MSTSKKASLVAGQAYLQLSLPDQVRLARPLATELLIEGIDFCARHSSDSTIDRICALADVPYPMSLIEEKLNDQEDREVSAAVEAAIAAALALGIAVGQCLTHQALNGGAR